jgi:hypothetical protein
MFSIQPAINQFDQTPALDGSGDLPRQIEQRPISITNNPILLPHMMRIDLQKVQHHNDVMVVQTLRSNHSKKSSASRHSRSKSVVADGVQIPHN